MLVGAFEIQVRREVQFRTAVAATQCVVAGVEPDIQGVGHLVVLRRLRAQQVRGVEFEPGVDAALFDALGDLLDQLRVSRMQLAGRWWVNSAMGTPQ